MFEDYHWKKRILLILSDDPAKINSQKRILDKYIPELNERRMMLFGFGATCEPYSSIDISELKAKYSDRLGSVLLFGLDGQEKASWNIPVDPVTVFKVIDAMPMRRREIKEKESK